MNGAQLMRGEPLGPAVPPRAIDRYPSNIIIDFRRCSILSLKKYCQKYDILMDNLSSIPHSELALSVAKHFQHSLHVKEDYVLKNFTEFTLSYSGGNTLEDVKYRNAKRLRKRTRRATAGELASASAGVSGGNSRSGSAIGLVIGGASGHNVNGFSEEASDDENGGNSGLEDQEIVLYCICNRPSFGEMVACDSEDCQGGEWFHVSCVGLKEGQVPAHWFCPECEKRRNNGDATSKRKKSSSKRRATTD
jgi:hypothetical protein